jgi:hypothetical protein
MALTSHTQNRVKLVFVLHVKKIVVSCIFNLLKASGYYMYHQV